MTKVALAMIVKHTEPVEFMKRCLLSVAPYVDGIYLTINSPEEKETKEAKSLKKELIKFAKEEKWVDINFSYTKWEDDFSKARNYNFSLVPPEFEYIIWLDADDVLRGGKHLKEVAEHANERGFGAVYFNYLYEAEIRNGKVVNVLIEHLRERLVRNDGTFKWIAPIHETLIGQRESNNTDNGLLDVLHMSNHDRGNEAIKRNVRILEKQLEGQERKDPRTMYYLAKSYFDLKSDENWQKAEKLILGYLNGSDTNTPSGWAEERAQAYEYLAEIYRETGQYNKAIKSTANAMIEDPKFPNFFIQMGLHHIYKKEWAKAKFWVTLAQHVPYPKTTIVLNPRDMQLRTLEVLFNSCVQMNQLEEAWAAAVKLQELLPDDDIMKQRVGALTELRQKNKLAHKVVDIAHYLYDTKQIDKLKVLVGAIPQQIEDEPVMLSLRRDFTEPRVWADDEVAIVCGKGFEKWSPNSLVKGIGGSEEAVIYLSRELAKLGWKVTVYADPQEEAGVYEGVNYLPYYKLNPGDVFNMFIGWRNVAMFEEPWKYKKSFLWLHDIQNAHEYTQKRVDNITTIFALSKWHRDNMPNVPDHKFMLTGNGIDLSMFKKLDEENIVRNPYRIIWTSSYDRGLEHLLKMWPDIKKEVPQAELHVFYGWKLFEEFYHNNPERMAWKAKIDDLMKQEGITHHGRAGQMEVLRETYKAGVWAYPTHFGEISCITAMKCQAAGAIPVVCDYAALKETVQHGVKVNVDDSDIYDPDIKREFKNQLIKVLKLGKAQDDVREPMMAWARGKFSWENIAKQWDAEFRKDKLKDAMDTILKEHPEADKFMPLGLQEKYGLKQTY